jgi:hypothetical protein
VADNQNLAGSGGAWLIHWAPFLSLVVAIVTASDTRLKPLQKWPGFMESRARLVDIIVEYEQTAISTGPETNLTVSATTTGERISSNAAHEPIGTARSRAVTLTCAASTSHGTLPPRCFSYSMQETQPSTSVPSNAIWRRRM